MFQVCDIINKLLAKNAEDRYQSAEGLLADLRICMQGLRSSSSCLSSLAGVGKSELQGTGLFNLFFFFLLPLRSPSLSFPFLQQVRVYHFASFITTQKRAML